MDLRLATVIYDEDAPTEVNVRLFIHETSGENRRATGTVDITVFGDDVKSRTLAELEKEAIEIAVSRII